MALFRSLMLYLSDSRDRDGHALGGIDVSARHLKCHGVQTQPAV